MTDEIKMLMAAHPVIRDLAAGREVSWINPGKQPFAETAGKQELGPKDMEDAAARLLRFAPFIRLRFPETQARGGLIESELKEIGKMRDCLNEKCGSMLAGRLLLKMDSHLAVAGSVKARGGIYEVLKHTEELALRHGILTPEEAADSSPANTAYRKLAEPAAREIFSRYTVQVGSTGNLGMSIGIMSAAVGFRVIVHMSADAKQWKKDLLRSRGVEVIEYASDYSEAVKNGRALSDADPMSYFVDDENSRSLFLGYAVAAKRLAGQLAEQKITVNQEHPLFVYIPCGVGGAPGGICFGLKQIFGDAVHVFFAEPVQASCMLLGLASGKHNGISVQDIGLSGLTDADGLAVGRPSGFVGRVIEPHLSGEFTVKDARLYDWLRDLFAQEEIFLEPSACAAFQGPVRLMRDMQPYLEMNGLREKMKNAAHIVWATGGGLVPEAVRKDYLNTFREG